MIVNSSKFIHKYTVRKESYLRVHFDNYWFLASKKAIYVELFLIEKDSDGGF